MDSLIDTLFNFTGRLSRRNYVFSVLGIIVSFIVCSVIWTLTPIDDPQSFNYKAELVVFLTIVFVHTWALFAITAKRLHDVGRSGWDLMFIWLPFIFPLMFPSIAVSLASYAANIGIFLALSLVPTKSEEIS